MSKKKPDDTATRSAASPTTDREKAYEAWIDAVDRVAAAEKAGNAEAIKAAKRRYATTKARMKRLDVKVPQQPIAAPQEPSTKLADDGVPPLPPRWVRMADASGLLALRYGKPEWRIRELLISAVEIQDLKHRIEGWNAKHRQWDFMHASPFAHNEGGSRMPRGCEEVGGTARVYDWQLARMDWYAGTIINHLDHRSSIELLWARLDEWAMKRLAALPDHILDLDSAKHHFPPEHEAAISVKGQRHPAKRGGPDYQEADKQLVAEAVVMIRDGKANDATDAARALAERAPGKGTPASRVKRLIPRINRALKDQ
jgi:hypothetical protein